MHFLFAPGQKVRIRKAYFMASPKEGLQPKVVILTNHAKEPENAQQFNFTRARY